MRKKIFSLDVYILVWRYRNKSFPTLTLYYKSLLQMLRNNDADEQKCLIESLPAHKLFLKDGKYNITHLKSHLMEEGTLKLKDMKELQQKFMILLKNEPNLRQISGSVSIIGDIHGQYYDFLKILSLVPDLDADDKKGSYLFLGDYVDRGANSVQVITLIMAMKVNHPNRIVLLRGNHESRCMTSYHNFMAETISKYNQEVYESFMSAYDSLPLACLVNKKFFCVHGGISDKLLSVKSINEINRFCEIPLEGAFCDFIWSDPVSNDYELTDMDSEYNQSRQCSIFFGKQLTEKFQQQNQIITIIRAHEVFPQGFKKYSWKNSQKKQNFPDILTVFSAPNYCGVYGNRGAIIKMENQSFQIRQYREESVNNKLYEYLDVFKWAMPEVCRVVNEFSSSIMTTFFHLYFKKQFPELWKKDDDFKLQVLLSYIKKSRKGMMEEEPEHLVKSGGKSLEISKGKFLQVVHDPLEEKDRLFNRSVDYFKQEEQRPKVMSSDFKKTVRPKKIFSYELDSEEIKKVKEWESKKQQMREDLKKTTISNPV